jgi:hypothetical protein
MVTFASVCRSGAYQTDAMEMRIRHRTVDSAPFTCGSFLRMNIPVMFIAMLYSPRRWTLRDRGRNLVVQYDGARQVRLEADGQPVAHKPIGLLGDAVFDLGPVDDVVQTVRVSRGLRARLRRVDLLEKDPEALTRRPLTTPFVPPEGTKARRLYAFREAHPHLYAARHVVTEVLAVLVGVVGIGALVSAMARSVLHSINMSWLPDLPDISPPEWLRNLDPLSWLFRLLPEWDWFGWLPDLDMPWLQYLVPVVVAILVAVGEVERRKKRTQRERHSDTPENDDAHG